MNPNPSVPWLMQFSVFRSLCGVFELADWSSITLTGSDRQTFLHNFCTNDVKRLAAGESCEAFFTDVKGRIVGHGLITCRESELVVIGPSGQAASLVAHLDRYVIRENVTVRDTTADRSYLLLAGGEEARGFAVGLAPRVEIGQSWLKPLVNAAGKLVDIPVRWIRWDLLGNVFCGLLEMVPADAPRVRHLLIERGAELRDDSVFRALRIEAGTALFGVDFDDRNLPQEVDRNQQAISFTKGCYLGQETVARIDALGHVNQRIVGVRFAGTAIPEVGCEITDAGKTVGHLTSSTFSPRLHAPLALAMIRRESSEIGSRLESAVGKCEVVALPLDLPIKV